jgi:hypothetical protein
VKYKLHTRQYPEKGERSRVRGKKYVLMLTLTVLLVTIIPYVPPVKSGSTVKVYVAPEFPNYVPQNTTGTNIYMNVYIESPPEWYDSNETGIVGWAMTIKVNASVLEPMTIYGATGGYWLFDFADTKGGGTSLQKTTNKTTGEFYEASEQILGWQTHPFNGSGAGGNGKLCRLRYKVLDEDAWTLIDLGYPSAGSDFITFYYYVGFVKHEADIIIDGNYNQPPFMYMHSVGSLIDLSSPVGTSWHELYPTYCTGYTIADWTDNGDGNLSSCDYIQLGTDWYHVEYVTVTIRVTDTAGGKTYEKFFESTGWEYYMDETITDPRNNTWHEVYGNVTKQADPLFVFCRVYNITSWDDRDASGNITVGDEVTTDLDPGPGPNWDVLEVSTDIVIRGPTEVVPEFPLGLALEIGLIAAVAYVWWRSRRKTKITKQEKLAY